MLSGREALLHANKVSGLIVLDEPTVGLHPTDAARIIDVIEQTTARTNADWTITTGPGPGAGPHGGRIVE